MKKLIVLLVFTISTLSPLLAETPDGPYETGFDFYGAKDNEGKKESKVTAEVMARAGVVSSFDYDALEADRPSLNMKNVLEADIKLKFNIGAINVFESSGVYGYLNIQNLLNSTTITGASYSDENHSYYTSEGYPSMRNGLVVYTDHTPSISGMLGSATYDAKLVMGDMYLQLAGNGLAMNPTGIGSGKTVIKSSFMAMELLGGVNWESGNFTAVDFGMLNGVAYKNSGKGGTFYPTTGNVTFGLDTKKLDVSFSVGTESLIDPDSNNSTGELSGSIPFAASLSYVTPIDLAISVNGASAYRSTYVEDNLTEEDSEDDLYLSAANKYDYGVGLKLSLNNWKPFGNYRLTPYLAGSYNQLAEGYEDQYVRLAAGEDWENNQWSVGAGFELVTGMAAYTYDVAGFNEFCGYDLIGSITRANIVDDSINAGVIYDSTGLLQAKITGFNYNLVPNSSIGFLVEVDDILESRVDYLSDPMGKRWAAGFYYDYNLYNKLRPFIWGKYKDNYVITYDNGLTSEVREENGYVNSQLRVDTGDELILSTGFQSDIIKHLRVVASWTSGNLIRQEATVYDIFTNEDINVPKVGNFTISAMVNL